MQIFTGVISYTNTYTLTPRAHSAGFIMTAAQANATGSMTDPLPLPLSSLSPHVSDPKAAVRCHAEHPAVFIPSMTEE